MTAFVLLSTVVFFFLTMVWTRKTWANTGFKIMFALLTIVGTPLSLGQFGYLVKV